MKLKMMSQAVRLLISNQRMQLKIHSQTYDLAKVEAVVADYLQGVSTFDDATDLDAVDQRTGELMAFTKALRNRTSAKAKTLTTLEREMVANALINSLTQLHLAAEQAIYGVGVVEAKDVS